MLNIGDFARFAGVTVRMLRHYDALGLLVPTEVDPHNGYRRYDESLLARAHQLVALKELGFGLEQIGELLDAGPDGLRRHLAARVVELQQQIAADRARLDEVERRLRLIEGGTMELDFTERPLPELTVTQLVGEVADQPQIGPVIGPMFERLVAASGVAEPETLAWYDAGDDGIRFGACVAGDVSLDGAESATLAAAPRAVVTTYRGPIMRIAEAWQAVGAHLADRGLQATGVCREAYHEVPADGAWAIELQQPVA